VLAAPVTPLEYLARIGYTEEAANLLIARQPSEADLAELLQKNLVAVPFENLGQHEHLASEGTVAVAAVMPSNDVNTSLAKIVKARRGGFCLEITPCFAWLLRKLGYKVRIANSNVMSPGGPVPGHLVLLVDGLRSDSSLMVDPGFGDYVRIPIPMSARDDGAEYTDDMVGDVFSLKATTEYGERFNTVLMRSRKTGMMGSPSSELFEVPDMPLDMTPPEPMHIFNDTDDLAYDADELKAGLAAVLTVAPMNFFSQKRICMSCTPQGYKFLGKDYFKEKVNGKEIRRTSLKDEAEWRRTLEDEFGVKLS